MIKTNYLFPNRFKKIGWVIFIPVVLFYIFGWDLFNESDFFKVKVFALLYHDMHHFRFVVNNIFDEIVSILIIVSSIFIAFSKEKNEDEFISKIRLESLVWATYLNYAILTLAIIFIYDLTFFQVLVYNMFTLLVFFIIRFNWAIYKSKKSIEYEK